MDTSVFISLITLSYSIPQSALMENCKKSAIFLDSKGEYPEIFGVTYFRLDYYTDALMVNAALISDNKDIMRTSLLCPYYPNEDGPAQGILSYINSSKLSDVSQYGRYWHGYLVVLKPLLLIFTYPQILIINFVLLVLLACFCAYLISCNISKEIGMCFCISLLTIFFPIVPLALQFSTCFYIAFLSIILLLKFPSLTMNSGRSIVFFFIVGGSTAFFDLLTTPQITLGLPLSIYLLRDDNKDRIKHLFLLGMIWAMGYASIWVSKWFIAYLFTGENVIMDAIGQASYRLAGEYNPQGIARPIKMLIYSSPILAIICTILYKRFGIGKAEIKNNLYLLLIATFVPIWYLVLKNHSIEHFWFTWRALILPVFCILCFLSRTLKISNHERS